MHKEKTTQSYILVQVISTDRCKTFNANKTHNVREQKCEQTKKTKHEKQMNAKGSVFLHLQVVLSVLDYVGPIWPVATVVNTYDIASAATPIVEM